MLLFLFYKPIVILLPAIYYYSEPILNRLPLANSSDGYSLLIVYQYLFLDHSEAYE